MPATMVPTHYEFIRCDSSAKSIDMQIFDSIMRIIMSNDNRPEKKLAVKLRERLSKEKLMFLLTRVTTLLMHEQTVIEVEPPIFIYGDTHGQFSDLLDIIDNIGWPPHRKYLFMGDYVDRGDQSLELICLLFDLKVKYPDKIFLLRGNHETSEINANYGFRDDCLLHYDISVWDAFQDCFRCLPLVGVVGSRIIAMHGGLSPHLWTIEDIRKIPRPLDIPDDGLACDVLWSDPTPSDKHFRNCGFTENKARNTSVWYCPDSVREFLNKNGLDMVIRGHEMANEGYEFTPDKKVLTVFTAPHYCDYTNDGGVVYVDGELQCQIWVFVMKKYVDPNIIQAPRTPSPTGVEPWNELTLREKAKTNKNKMFCNQQL